MGKKYAKINSLNEVVKIYVVDDNETQAGVEALFGDTDANIYRETSDSIRERPAKIGGTYDSASDAFVDPRPYPSWTLNDSREWEPPVAEPTDEQRGDRVCSWDEQNQQWKGMQIVEGQGEVFSTWNPDTSSWS